jgi:hypothetical protein
MVCKNERVGVVCVFDQIKELTHQFVQQKKNKNINWSDARWSGHCAVHRCNSSHEVSERLWLVWLLAVVGKTRSLRALSKDDIVAVAGGFNTGTSSSRSTRRCLSQTCLQTFLNS